MKDKKKTAAVMIVLLALASTTAFADEVIVSASASGPAGGSPVNGTPGIYTADLEQFDPALGTLTSVELAISASHNGTIEFTNNATTDGGYIVFYVDYSFEVNGFGGTGGNLLFLDWVNEPTKGTPFGEAPGHFNTGVVNLAGGESSIESFGTQLDFADTYLAGDSEFSQFIGTGTLPFEIVDWAVFSLAVFGEDMSFVLASDASLTVDATYTFTPVPSPSSFALLFAFSGLFTVRRLRST